jgi:DNA-directed RNA polymerase specialized sigma24 family protein
MSEQAPTDDELFARLYPSLRRFAATIRPAEVDADDLVQDALARVLAAGTLGDLDDPGAYLRTVMLRLASNHRRSLGRRRRALTRLSVVEDARPSYPSDLDELRRLAPADRAVLYLVVVERATYREAARVLGCSEEAARTRSSRALKKLRTQVAHGERDQEAGHG